MTSLLSQLTILIGLCSCSVAIISYDNTFVKMVDKNLINTEAAMNASSACHCKMLCSVRPRCIGASFVRADNKCSMTTTNTVGAVVMEVAEGKTTWLKLNVTYEASKALEVGPSFFLTTTTTRMASLDGLTRMCASEGGTPANVRTNAQKQEYLRVVPAGAKAWVPVTQRGGVLVWQDGTPISIYSWLTVSVNTLTSSLNNGVLDTNGKLYMKDRMDDLYGIICARPPSSFVG